MRVVKIEKNVYTFEELSEEAKAKVIENNMAAIRPANVFSEETTEKIKAFGFEDMQLYYTLSSSQGDGLCFIGSIDISKLKSIAMFWDKVKDVCSDEFLKNLEECCYSIKIYKTTYYYSHSRTVSFNIDNNSWCDVEQYMKFLDTFKEFYRNICSHFEKEGYKYFYEISIEDARYWADMNDLEFLNDGTIFTEFTETI